MAAPDSSGKRTEQSVQEIANQGYDPVYGIPVVGLLGYNGGAVKRIQVNSDGEIITGGGTSATVYKLSDEDSASDPAYYGYLDADGGWYILKITESTGTYRYVKGASDYSTAWTDRASQTYVYYDSAF